MMCQQIQVKDLLQLKIKMDKAVQDGKHLMINFSYILNIII